MTTEAEQEALDDGALPTVNLARKLVNDVRRRSAAPLLLARTRLSAVCLP